MGPVARLLEVDRLVVQRPDGFRVRVPALALAAGGVAALHGPPGCGKSTLLRAILGLPIPNIHQHGPSASCAVLVEGESSNVQFGALDQVLSEPDTQVRLFGKPTVSGQRRMAVTLARSGDIETARAKAHWAAQAMEIRL